MPSRKGLQDLLLYFLVYIIQTEPSGQNSACILTLLTFLGIIITRLANKFNFYLLPKYIFQWMWYDRAQFNILGPFVGARLRTSFELLLIMHNALMFTTNNEILSSHMNHFMYMFGDGPMPRTIIEDLYSWTPYTNISMLVVILKITSFH
ncbi:hypothetical protein ACJX0J_007935, partial [Zea mays]